MIQSTMIPIMFLQTNEGQIEGLPENPRFIKDAAYDSLKESLIEDPDMLQLREVIAYPFEGNYVVLGGNMRLRAARELGFEELPVKILPQDTDLEKLKRLVIKDNGSWGSHDWDKLANEWDSMPLEKWGIELPSSWGVKKEATDDDYSDDDDETPNSENLWFLNIQFENEEECQKWYEKLTEEGLYCKIVQ